MTTGVRNSDDRQLVQQIWNGNPTSTYLSIGSVYHKDWSGVDNQPGTALEEHPYSMNVSDAYDSLATVIVKNINGVIVNQYTRAAGVLGVPLSTTTAWNANSELKLMNKVATKIRGSDLNVGNLIAEIGQTTALFADSASRIAKMLHYIHRGNLYEAARSVSSKGVVNSVNRKVFKKNPTVGDASNAILELQYGWRPLISDVHSAVEGLANRAILPKKLKTNARKTSKSNTIIHPQGGIDWVIQQKTTVNVRVIHSEISTNTIYHLNDPLSALYEITPYSFVADWFIPVSDYLGALDFRRNFGVTSYWRSEKTIASCHPIGVNATNTDIIGLDGCFAKKVSFTRNSFDFSNLASLPLPEFKSVSKALSPEHLLNAGALLTANASRFKTSLKF